MIAAAGVAAEFVFTGGGVLVVGVPQAAVKIKAASATNIFFMIQLLN